MNHTILGIRVYIGQLGFIWCTCMYNITNIVIAWFNISIYITHLKKKKLFPCMRSQNFQSGHCVVQIEKLQMKEKISREENMEATLLWIPQLTNRRWIDWALRSVLRNNGKRLKSDDHIGSISPKYYVTCYHCRLTLPRGRSYTPRFCIKMPAKDARSATTNHFV